jgi:hypothetical protein
MSTESRPGRMLRCVRALLAALLVAGLAMPAAAQRSERGERSGDERSRGDERGRNDDRGRRDDDRGRGDRNDRGWRDGNRHDRDRHDHGRREWGRSDRNYYRGDWRPRGMWRHDRNVVIYGGRPVIVRPERRRVYRDVVVLRPYGHFYGGYGRFYRDSDAYPFLGLSAITFAMLDFMSENQQRALEEAQIRATTAGIGEPIIWDDGNARGQVIATREGQAPDGRYCREFQQEVTIGGRREEAYGTACQQPDGAWQVVED